MYDNLIDNYKVVYEGAIAPIFYKYFYPMGFERENEEHWRLFHYARGLKNDKPSDKKDYDTYACEYERDLRFLLNQFVKDTKGLRRGVFVIPSSTAGRVNRVTELVRRVIDSEHASTASNLSRYLQRTQSKVKAHQGGTRSAVKGIETLRVSPECMIQNYGAILVLDDITTSGNSFLTVDILLRKAGFKGQIVNFAFSRTFPSEGVDLFMRWEVRNSSASAISARNELQPVSSRGGCHSGVLGYRVFFPDGSVLDFEGEYKVVKKAHYAKHFPPSMRRELRFTSHMSVQFENGQIIEFDNPDDCKRRVKRIMLSRKVEGLVFDLDDTLICDTPRQVLYEEYLSGNEAQDSAISSVPSCPYRPYEGIRAFMSMGIPFAVVSNRPIKALSRIVDDPIVNDSIYPGRIKRDRQTFEEWQTSGRRFYPLELIEGTGTAVNQHKNLFSYPKRQVGGRLVNLYKPCPQGVLQAVQLIRSSNGLSKEARIVGIGNTLEDIIAYNAAGIESALALWGVPNYLREYAKRQWGADYCFDSVAELGKWCGIK